MSQFVHLRLHTEYSLLDGIVRVPELMAAVAAAGMPAVALTDLAAASDQQNGAGNALRFHIALHNLPHALQTLGRDADVLRPARARERLSERCREEESEKCDG